MAARRRGCDRRRLGRRLIGGAALAAVSGVELVPIDLYDGSVLHRLVWGNVVLGTFNLLPAFPMDGGRVLRAALALRWSLERATRAAAVVGRALAMGLAAVGMLFNLWLVLIAAFVYVGASAEELATRAHVRFKGRRVEDARWISRCPCRPRWRSVPPRASSGAPPSGSSPF